MKVKIIALSGFFLFTSQSLSAMTEEEKSSGKPQDSSRSNLKLLKIIHEHNEIFDNYSTGGIAP